LSTGFGRLVDENTNKGEKGESFYTQFRLFSGSDTNLPYNYWKQRSLPAQG
jgi:hypothetical protein